MTAKINFKRDCRKHQMLFVIPFFFNTIFYEKGHCTDPAADRTDPAALVGCYSNYVFNLNQTIWQQR